MHPIVEKIRQIGIIPVIKLDDAQHALPLAQALVDGGLPAAEVTFRTAAAEASIRAMTESFPDLLIGAGTVLNCQQVDTALQAGAKFIVSPGTNLRVVRHCLELGVPILPGVVTPTEIEAVLELGLDVLKFFPAEPSGGLPMIEALAAPYTGVTFMPTGGINASNVGAYLASPKILACGGSWMVKDAMIRDGKFDQITQLIREAAGHCPKYPWRDQKMSKKVVTFGEIMLRLAPNGYYRFFQSDQMQATFGGGEANVAVSLANYGLESLYVTKLPDHAIGQAAVDALRAFGVDTSRIVRGGDRVGIYYLEKGASQRGSLCIYDRAHSAIQEAQPSDFDWDAIFEGADWFHFTGITPALGPGLVEICKQACQSAKAKGLKISCDLNYRGKLWSRQEARAAMTNLCQYVDVCISNEEDAKDVFGIEAPDTDIYGGKLNKDGYQWVAKELARKFSFEKVAITLRTSLSASDNDWAGMLYDGTSCCFSKTYHLHIVDRVGGGDSFGGGLIYALLSGKSSQEAIEFAVAASALKHSIEGDFNRVSVTEVEKLAGGDGSGRVQR